MSAWSSRIACAALCCAGLVACGGDDKDTNPADGGGAPEVAGQSGQSAGASAAAGSGGRAAAGRGGGGAGAAGIAGRAGAAAGVGGAGTGGREAGTGGRDAGAPDASTMDASTTDASTPDAGPAAELAVWKLVWSDEFDGAKGAKLDASKWVYETGGSGWGNNQLEFDTDRAQNASLDGSGELTITAIKESYMGKSYTSVRLNTNGKFSHLYGRYETRMKIPFGPGMWPAFWMMGVDSDNVGWPTRGEIDIMENIGREPDTIHGTLHGPGYSGGNGIGAPSKLAMSQRFADDYHVFAVEWEKEVVRWYVDGKLYQTRTPKDLPNGAKWVYDHPFFILLNLAVGGQWPGNPDSSTMFPQTLKVDYVRVYDRAE